MSGLTVAAPSADHARLFEALASRLDNWTLADGESVDDLADRMVMATSKVADSQWAELIGAVYTTAALVDFLGVTRQAINQRVHSRGILRLVTASGRAVYPAFQFAANGQTAPSLKDVLRTLATGVDDPWTWAQWLAAPDAQGVRHIDRLWAGLDAGVLLDARQTAAQWAL
ncbi:MAG: hypothetical protein FWD59_02535 [Micrococcales bacterium]|nr:hypothetical protein [Micrococcales bacterium]